MSPSSNASYIFNLGQLFSEIAGDFWSHPALLMLDGSSTTYGSLDSLSNQVASWLTKQGIVSGDVVAIFNRKLPLSYACMIACLKIGAIYVNLDPSSPSERLRKMIKSSGAVQLWAWGDDAAQGLGDMAPRLVDYSSKSLMAELDSEPDIFPKENADVHGGSVAYIMFTSGSTGFPKGAAITHNNLLNLIGWVRETFQIKSEDRITNLNPMHFDNSVFDVYSSLFSGASMVPVPEEHLKNPRRMLDALNPINCTIWFSVPSLIIYALKMRALCADDLPSLRTMLFGGEGFPKGSLRSLAKLLMPRVKLVNVYGPTECTCICSSYEVQEEDLDFDELLPLGPIASNFQYLIIDEQGLSTTAGAIGELYLGGPNVGAGYYDNAEMSYEAFVQNPDHSLFRDTYYKTGDLVRYDIRNNLLFFCGRKDNQIKRMGYRIELEEIEYAIGSLPNVIENVVTFSKSHGDVGKIVAYVTASGDDEFALLESLRTKLPPYMIPDQVVFRDGLPKNQNGKIDRGTIQKWG